MRKVFVPALAIITVCSSVFFSTDVRASLHASAGSLEDRVSARRSARKNANAGMTILELRQLRQQRRAPASSSSSSSSATSIQRRKRTPLVVPNTPPLRTSRRSTLLERRNARRNKRITTLPSPTKAQLIDAINIERAKMAKSPLRAQQQLETAAQRHAEDMLARAFFSHENPDGTRSAARIKAAGYGKVNAQECRCNYKVFMGENLAKGQTSIEQVVAEWLNSPSHRDAMLSKDYDEIGVGLIEDIWVLNFGKVEIIPLR